MHKVLAITLLAMSPWLTWAESEPVEEKPTKSVTGEAEMGATLTTGNTDTSSYKAKLGFIREIGNWRNQYLLEGLYSEDTNTVTAKRFLASMQINYQLTERGYWFATPNYEVDPFTGYQYSVSGATGYGYQVYDTDKTSLNIELGPGYTYQRLDAEQAMLLGYNSANSIVAYSAVHLATKIAESSRFEQRVVVDYGNKLEARSETALIANVIGALAMKFSVAIRYNSEPLDDKQRTDTETNMTLLYSF